MVLAYKAALPYEPQRRKGVEYYLVATTEFEPGSVERSGYSYPLVDLDEQVHEPHNQSRPDRLITLDLLAAELIGTSLILVADVHVVED